MAHETNATFIKIVASEFVKKYIGEGARLVRGVFELAKEKAPSIIFIDEIDAIAAKRLKSSTSGDREVQRTLMQLLAEMDGFEGRGNVGIVAATNRPDILIRHYCDLDDSTDLSKYQFLMKMVEKRFSRSTPKI